MSKGRQPRREAHPHRLYPGRPRGRKPGWHLATGTPPPDRTDPPPPHPRGVHPRHRQRGHPGVARSGRRRPSTVRCVPDPGSGHRPPPRPTAGRGREPGGVDGSGTTPPPVVACRARRPAPQRRGAGRGHRGRPGQRHRGPHHRLQVGPDARPRLAGERRAAVPAWGNRPAPGPPPVIGDRRIGRRRPGPGPAGRPEPAAGGRPRIGASPVRGGRPFRDAALAGHAPDRRLPPGGTRTGGPTGPGNGRPAGPPSVGGGVVRARFSRPGRPHPGSAAAAGAAAADLEPNRPGPHGPQGTGPGRPIPTGHQPFRGTPQPAPPGRRRQPPVVRLVQRSAR